MALILDLFRGAYADPNKQYLPEKEMKNKETIDKFELMEGLAWRCICYVQYFQLTSGQPGKFWPVVQNAIGDAACLFWPHLFGNREDNFHYSKFFPIEEVAQADDKFSLETIKPRLIDRIGMNEFEYKAFWKEVKSCRDKFVAHRDSNGVGIIFPKINLCREMAEELRDIFLKLYVHGSMNFQIMSNSKDLKTITSGIPIVHLRRSVRVILRTG